MENEKKLTVEQLFGKIEFWQTLKRKSNKRLMNTKPIERFYRKVEIDFSTGCWNFRGSKNQFGYGQFKVAGKLLKAHRFLYESLFGEIPEGLEVDHLCKNTSCCSPFHLEPVTKQENLRRTRKEFCAKGHPIFASRWGQRFCNTCRNDRRRAKRKNSAASK